MTLPHRAISTRQKSQHRRKMRFSPHLADGLGTRCTSRIYFAGIISGLVSSRMPSIAVYICGIPFSSSSNHHMRSSASPTTSHHQGQLYKTCMSRHGGELGHGADARLHISWPRQVNSPRSLAVPPSRAVVPIRQSLTRFLAKSTRRGNQPPLVRDSQATVCTIGVSQTARYIGRLD